MPYVKAIAKSELHPGQGKAVQLSGKKIALFNVEGRFVAIDDTCTHDEASLAEGTVSCENGKCIVECPWHGAHFDLSTGAALTLPAVQPVKTYPTRVEGDAIEVEV
jgi:3-phenylpropionate/trans-cinnamate dioxygenase ferredoxin component